MTGLRDPLEQSNRRVSLRVAAGTAVAIIGIVFSILGGYAIGTWFGSPGDMDRKQQFSDWQVFLATMVFLPIQNFPEIHTEKLIGSKFRAPLIVDELRDQSVSNIDIHVIVRSDGLGALMPQATLPVTASQIATGQDGSA